MSRHFTGALRAMLICILCFQALVAAAQQSASNYRLIAHRGGVVDSTTHENSRQSILKAIDRGYWMIEIDLRLTKDSVLVIHHDKTLERYYQTNKHLDQLTWQEVAGLRSPSGDRILLFEEALALAQGKINVMIDNKFEGYDTAVFARVVTLLRKYRLQEHALMIGTDASTEYFTGKVKLSCTRQQLEENMRRPDYNPDHYYLFGREISREDAQWARDNGIMTVAALNSWAFRGKDGKVAQQVAKDFKNAGITTFQIDSVYEPLFR